MALGHDKPNEDLLHELEQVAEAARGLINALTSANTPLPHDFPEDQTLALLAPLTRLTTGTAEGCFGPLDTARRRLPKLRRQFILTEERAETATSDTPPLTRGGRIDLKLQAVTTAVGTALDEYAEQAGTEPDLEDEAGAEISAETRQSLDETAAEATTAAEAMDAVAVETEAFGFPSSEPLDRLIRQERAAAMEAATASAEAGMPVPQAKLLERLGRRIRDYPKLIVETGKIVRTSAKVTGWLYEKWEGFWDTQIKAALEYTIAVGDELVAEGSKMQWPSVQGPSKPRPPPIDDPEVDDETREAAEAEARANILEGSETSAETAKLVRSLHISGKSDDKREIPVPALLAKFANLRTLRCSHTSLDDILVLAGLAKLQALHLEGTGVTDITLLAGLAQLEELALGGTGVTDIAPLAGLAQLQRLSLSGTGVTDIAPLAGLAQLQWLYLNETGVTDIAPLAGLAQLQWLYLSGTGVTDIAPLAGLTQLISLYLNETGVTDIAPLAGLAQLQRLYLSGTGVTDIAPLAGLTQLQRLYLTGTGVSDWSPVDHVDDVGGRPKYWSRRSR